MALLRHGAPRREKMECPLCPRVAVASGSMLDFFAAMAIAIPIPIATSLGDQSIVLRKAGSPLSEEPAFVVRHGNPVSWMGEDYPMLRRSDRIDELCILACESAAVPVCARI